MRVADYLTWLFVNAAIVVADHVVRVVMIYKCIFLALRNCCTAVFDSSWFIIAAIIKRSHDYGI